MYSRKQAINELAVPSTKLLVKLFLGDIAAALFGDVIVSPIKKLADGVEERELEGYFKHLGENAAEHVAIILDNEQSPVPREWLLAELKLTLDSALDPEKIAAANCNSPELEKLFRELRPVDTTWNENEKQAYYRGIQVAANLIESVAFTLPKVHETISRKLLLRVAALEETVKSRLTEIAHVERLKVERYEKDYRLRVISSEDRMQLFGAGLDNATAQYPLTVSYISLRLRLGKSLGESNDAEYMMDGLPPTIRRLQITGVAGSGKSTLMKWLAVTAARRIIPSFEKWRQIIDPQVFLPVSKSKSSNNRRFSQDDEKEAIANTEALNQAYANIWRTRIPFLIRMRDVYKDGIPVPSALGAWLAAKSGHLPQSWVDDLLHQGRAILLFDGFDEVPASKREEIGKVLAAICRNAGSNLVIMSSRPMPGELTWMQGLGFREATLDYLSNAEKGQLIDNWFEAFASEKELGGDDGSQYRQRAKELRKSLFQNPAANDLARVPLLCALLCAVYIHTSTRELPNELPALCERICRMLIHDRAVEHLLPVRDFGPVYLDLTYAEKRALIQKLAVTMVTDGESQLEFEHAKAVVKKMLQSKCGEYEAEPFLQTLILLCGLLQHGEGNTVTFIHNTIKEFLAAEELANDRNVTRLTKSPSDPVWQNVALIAAASNRNIGIDIARRLLALDKDGETSQERQDAELLALRCRAVIPLPGDELTRQFNDVQAKYLPPNSDYESVAVAAGGAEVVERLRYRKHGDEMQAYYCIQALRLMNNPDAEKALAEYAQVESRLLPLEALTEFYNPLFIKSVVKYLTGSFERGVDQVSRIIPQITDEHLEQIGDSELLTIAKILILSGASISNIEPLGKLQSLEELNINDTSVADISPVKNLSKLTRLSLRATPVGDLSAIRSLTKLDELDIRDTPITDLTPLSKMNSLQRLWLSGTKISNVEVLSSLPRLRVING